MARRKPKLYTAAELRAIKVRLIEHRGILACGIESNARAFRVEPSHDRAIEIRDDAQCLCVTCTALDNIDMFIANAEHTGMPNAFEINDCGLTSETRAGRDGSGSVKGSRG